MWKCFHLRKTAFTQQIRESFIILVCGIDEWKALKQYHQINQLKKI